MLGMVSYSRRPQSGQITCYLNRTYHVLPTLSRYAVERLITKYTHLAARTCLSLRRKNVSPHVLRHSTAMDLLQHGVDRSVIALWLGHESVETTQMYLHADMR